MCDSLADGRAFRESQESESLDHVNVRNATALFRECPTAVISGPWSSTGKLGGAGAKSQRTVVSEIVVYDRQRGRVRGASENVKKDFEVPTEGGRQACECLKHAKVGQGSQRCFPARRTQ